MPQQQIILNIQTNFKDNIDELVKLQQELDNLRVTELQVNAAVKSGTKTRQEADKELEAIAAAIRNVKSQQQSYRKEIDNEIKAHKENEGSIKQMRLELAAMRKEYESLSKADRESAGGEALLQNIADTTEKLKGLEQAQGDWRREVGHYQNALQSLDPLLGKLYGGFANLSNGTFSVAKAFKQGVVVVKNFSLQLLKLLANPIVAIIAAIAAVVMKLVDSFKKNDVAMTELQSAFAAFKPILDIIEKGFQKLVGVVTKVVSAIGKVVKGVMSVIPGMKEYADAEEDIVRRTDALEDAERQYSENHAQREAEIAELREKAADSENYTYEQRKEFLDKAGKLEEEDLKERKELAAEKVDIAEKQALLEIGETEMTAEAWEKLTDEQKDHIIELRNELAQADKDYSTHARKIKKEKNSLNKQEESDRKSRANAAAQAAKERADKEREALRTLEDMYFNAIGDLEAKEYAMSKANGERLINELKNRLKTEKNLTAAAKKALQTQIILAEADLQIKLGEIRDKYSKENYIKQLNNDKTYYETLLKSVKDEDRRVEIQLQLNKIDTDLLKKAVEDSLQQVKTVANEAQNDLNTLNPDQLAEKYAATWEYYGITTGDNMVKMAQLVAKYNNDVITETTRANNVIIAIDNAAAEQEKQIRDEAAKTKHDQELKELDLRRKHAEILRQIDLAGSYDEYGRNEAEKTRILQEQAEARLQVARDEYSRIAGEREKYTDEELTAIYGSLDAYNNAVLEANLKVVESENDVKDAVKAVSDESIKQKTTMIQTATTVMGSINNILGSMQGLFETMAEDNESYSDWATAMAMMQILVSTAISISNAVEGATAAGAATGAAAPFTTPVFIAEMIAIVVGAITNATTTLLKARQQKKSAPKFADGGIIGGGYAANSAEGRADNVTIAASKGEYIINAASVKRYGIPFFDSLNGGRSVVSVTRFADGGYISDATVNSGNFQFQMQMTRDIMKEAMSEIQPVVSVREITAAQNRVQMAENIAQR